MTIQRPSRSRSQKHTFSARRYVGLNPKIRGTHSRFGPGRSGGRLEPEAGPPAAGGNATEVSDPRSGTQLPRSSTPPPENSSMRQMASGRKTWTAIPGWRRPATRFANAVRPPIDGRTRAPLLPQHPFRGTRVPDSEQQRCHCYPVTQQGLGIRTEEAHPSLLPLESPSPSRHRPSGRAPQSQSRSGSPRRSSR